MGMFDSLYVMCPKCGGGLGFQTKSGSCTLDTFSLDKLPSNIAEEFDGTTEECYHCKHKIKFKMKVKLYLVIDKDD